MPGARFTAWFSEDERAALKDRADDAQTSENMIVRIAVRALLFDKPIPQWAKQNTTTGAPK